MKKQDVRDWQVMPQQCSSCPFREGPDGRVPDPKLLASVQVRVLTRASQICHHPTLHGKRQTHLCRGARDYQLMIFYRLGFLKEPTDRAWQEKADQL